MILTLKWILIKINMIRPTSLSIKNFYSVISQKSMRMFQNFLNCNTLKLIRT